MNASPSRDQPSLATDSRPPLEHGACLPAGLGQRLLAAVIDHSVLMLGQIALMVPVFYYWWSIDAPGSPSEAYTPLLVSLGVLALTFLLHGLYLAHCWGRGATLGKRVMGLAVVDARDCRAPIGRWRAGLRLIAYVLSLGAVWGFCVYFFVGRTLHDMIGRSQVIQRPRG